MNRILLSGGTVIDGTGGEPFAAGLLVEDGRIARIGRFDPPPDTRQWLLLALSMFTATRTCK